MVSGSAARLKRAFRTFQAQLTSDRDQLLVSIWWSSVARRCLDEALMFCLLLKIDLTRKSVENSSAGANHAKAEL